MWGNFGECSVMEFLGKLRCGRIISNVCYMSSLAKRGPILQSALSKSNKKQHF